MRWQTAARAVVAVAGLGTAVAIYVLTRERPPMNKPPLSLVADPNATLQSGAGKQVRTDGSRPIGHVTYAGFRQYADGRVQWDGFTYQLANGTVMSADLVEGKNSSASQDQPAEFTMAGHVVFRSSSGETLQGASATYNDTAGIANVPGAAAFSRPGMSGTGTGGLYERDTGAFKLLADTHVTMTADDPAAGSVEATSQSMTYERASKAMLFDQQARITRAAETMTASTANLYLSDDERRFRVIELRGNARVMPKAGKTSGLPEMQAEDIDLGFYDGSQALQRGALQRLATMVQVGEQGRQSIVAQQISFSMAPDGTTLTRLEAFGRPVVTLPASPGTSGRTITASSLVASGNDRDGLTAAVFDGGAEFVEALPAARSRPEGKRIGKGQKLSLVVKGQLDAIDVAAFERDVTFTSGDVIGDSDLGEYRAIAGELILRPMPRNARKPPRLTTAEMTVEAADIITVNLNSNDLYAKKNVRTSRQPDAASAQKASTSIFDGSSTLYGSGAEFWYTADTKKVRYVGEGSERGQLKQSEGTDDSLVIGDDLTLFQETQNLTATGHVESTFAMTAAGGSPSPYRATADALDYDDATRVVRYAGSARLRRTTGETFAKTVVLTLAKESRALDRMEATDEVRSSVEGGREAWGRRLVYEAGKDEYTLWGEPLTLWTKESDGTCSNQTGNYVVFDGSGGAPSFPGPPLNPTGPRANPKQPCPASLAAAAAPIPKK